MHGKIFVERNKLSSCLLIETRGFHVATKFSRTSYNRPRVLACKSWRTTQTCSTTTKRSLVFQTSKDTKYCHLLHWVEVHDDDFVYTSELTCWCPLWYVHVRTVGLCVSFAFYTHRAFPTAMQNTSSIHSSPNVVNFQYLL